jgi:phage virion morphogenesis protein
MYTVKLDDDVVQAALQRLSAGMDDLTAPMNQIGFALVASSKSRIDQGLSPDGTPFAPRSAATLKAYEKRKAVPKGGPLKLTGEMQQEIFHEAGSDYVEVGSNAIQSAVMQMGAEQGAFGAFIGKDKLGRDHFHSIPWGNIPARPFLGVSEDDRSVIQDTVEVWIASLADGTD